MPKTEKTWIYPLISLLLIIIVIMIIVIIITPQLFPSSSKLLCPRGYCYNDIYSGEKTCPPDPNGYVEYTPGIEVCNPPTGCNPSSDTPCTYYDSSLGTQCPGDTHYTGICPEGTDCRCLERVYCPDFAQVYFELVNVYNSGIPDYKTFVQNTVWISPTNAPRNDLPLSLGLAGQTSNLTCGLSEENLKLVWPYRTCIRGQFGINQADGLWYCMEPPFECGSGQYPIRHPDGTYHCETFIPDPFD